MLVFRLFVDTPLGWFRACSAMWGPDYDTIPCTADPECLWLGTCDNVTARCLPAGVAGERICMTDTGGEAGPVCGRF